MTVGVTVDMNVLLGRWPFYAHAYETVEGVLALMDRAGIDVAAVSSLNSVFYYDGEAGNHEVGRACAEHAERLIPFVVLNPNLLGGRRICISAWRRTGCGGSSCIPTFTSTACWTRGRRG